MKTIIATLQLFSILFFMGCSTQFHEPNPAKVIESTKKVRETLQKAQDNSNKVTKHIKDAQQTADEINVLSNTLMGRIDEILGILPAEFKPPMLLIKTDATDLLTKEVILTSSLGQAYQTQNTQETTLVQVKLFESQLEGDQLNYRKEAAELATTASEQSETIAWYRRHWWGSWIALGSGVIVILLFFALKAAGKIGFL